MLAGLGFPVRSRSTLPDSPAPARPLPLACAPGGTPPRPRTWASAKAARSWRSWWLTRSKCGLVAASVKSRVTACVASSSACGSAGSYTR